MNKQLYRPKKNRIIAGVCSGFAEYFEIDPTIIRIVTIIIALSGTGVLAYIIAAIIMPGEEKVTSGSGSWNGGSEKSQGEFANEQEKERSEWDQPAKYNTEKNKLLIGAIFIGIGILFMIKQFIPYFDYKYLVPILLIGIGGFIIFKGRR